MTSGIGGEAFGFALADWALSGAERRLVSELPTLDGHFEALRGLAESRLPQLEPDDDIVTQSEIAGARDGTGLLIVFVHPFGDDDGKDFVYEAMPALMGAVGARSFATLMTAWALPAGAAGDPSDPAFVPPSEHPDRQEVVAIFGSDGVESLYATRLLRRSPDGVEWAEQAWTVARLDAFEGADSGAMVDPMNDALMRVRLARARVLTMTRPDEFVSERLAELTRQHIELGVLELGEDGQPRPSAELVELARRRDLWELPVTRPDGTEAG